MISFDFIVGIVVGKILVGALLASSLFRNLALALAATAICILYLQEGIRGILTHAHAFEHAFVTRPNFAEGVVVGAIVAFIVFGTFLQRRAP